MIKGQIKHSIFHYYIFPLGNRKQKMSRIGLTVGDLSMNKRFCNRHILVFCKLKSVFVALVDYYEVHNEWVKFLMNILACTYTLPNTWVL